VLKPPVGFPRGQPAVLHTETAGWVAWSWVYPTEQGLKRRAWLAVAELASKVSTNPAWFVLRIGGWTTERTPTASDGAVPTPGRPYEAVPLDKI